MPGYDKPFDKAEYAKRVADTKRRMQAAGFDLLICQDPANMCWLTGFNGWSFYVPQCVLVHLEEEWPIWFGRAQDAKCASVTTDLGNGRTPGSSICTRIVRQLQPHGQARDSDGDGRGLNPVGRERKHEDGG